MHVVGLAGVTSTGKTTMAHAIKDRYGDRVHILEKISRKEIFEYAGLGTLENDLTKRSNKEKAIFDISRVELQIKKEIEAKEKGKPVFIDGCTLVKIAYLIYLSAPYIVQYFGEDKLTEIVTMGLEHVNVTYSSIFYLPVTRLPFKEADHRVFKNKFIRVGQDAIISRLLATEIRHSIDAVGFNNTDMNLVFDEIDKMGV